MKNQTITITLVIFFAGIVLSGCSFSNMNLADNKTYTVECKKSSDRISIRSVKIYEDDGITVVSGKIKLHKNRRINPESAVQTETRFTRCIAA